MVNHFIQKPYISLDFFMLYFLLIMPSFKTKYVFKCINDLRFKSKDHAYVSHYKNS